MTTEPARQAPQASTADTRFLAVSAGHSHTCGIKADGAVACWGLDGNDQASPPSGNFSQTPDVIRLAEKTTPLETQDGDAVVRLERGLELLHTHLRLNEGETTTLALFRVLSAPAVPVTVTLETEENDRQFLSVTPEQFAISEAGEVMVSITAIDNEAIAVIDPINITLSAEGDAPLGPVGMTTVTVINDDYAINFERQAITLEEGMSADVQLHVDPALLGTDRVTVTLRPSDSGQFTVHPPRIVFLKASTNQIVSVSVKEDGIAEPTKTFTVNLVYETDITATANPALINDALSVTVPADEITARVFSERTVIPEGASSLRLD